MVLVKNTGERSEINANQSQQDERVSSEAEEEEDDRDDEEEEKGETVFRIMARSTGEDAQALFHSLRSAYAATPKNLKVTLLIFPYSDLSLYLCVRYDWLVTVASDHRSIRGLCRVHCPDPGKSVNVAVASGY